MAPKVTVEDAHVRWTEPAFAVDRRIRACTPAPGAWSTFRGERIKLAPVTLTGHSGSAASDAAQRPGAAARPSRPAAAYPPPPTRATARPPRPAGARPPPPPPAP